MATAELKAKISLNNSEFTKGMKAVHRDVAAIQAVIGTAAAAALKLGVVLATVGGGAALLGLRSALKFGGDFSEMMARTGAEGKGLAILGQAMKDAGMSAEDAGPMINRMQKALLGTSLGGKPPLEQFKLVGEMIRGLKTPAEQTAAAMQIFGKSGGQMLAVFKDPAAMQNAAKILGGQADILARSAARFDVVSDALANVGVKFRGFFLGMAEKLLPTLERLANWLNGLDLSGIGASMGAAFQTAINVLTNAFKTGTMSELIGTAMKAGFVTGLDYLIRSMRGIANMIQEAFGQGMAVLAEPSFWSAMQEGLIAMFSGAVASMIDVFEGPLKALQDGLTFVFEKAGTMLGRVILLALTPILGMLPNLLAANNKQTNPRTFKEIQDQSTFSFGGTKKEDWAGSMGAAWEKAKKAMADLMGKGIVDSQALKDVFSKGFDSTTVFSGMSESLQRQLMDLAAKLNVPLATVVDAARTASGAGGVGLGVGLGGGTGKRYEAASALERIGAIIGGGAGIKAVDFAQRTATNTKSALTLLQQIAKNTAKMGGGAEAVYGT